MRWTAAQITEALATPIPAGLTAKGADNSGTNSAGNIGAAISGVSIDSRTIQPGELFIAIRGPNHDAHGFVQKALDRGAPAAVVARSRLGEYPEDVRARLFGVDDTLVALQRLASKVCEMWRKGAAGRRIGAVAGSLGKTTTKEIFAALLGTRFRVLKTQGNLNNEYGLPLTLLRLDDSYDAAVVELGMSHPGELAHLTRIASPDVGVVTRVAVEHLEFFASIEEIALAERELVEMLPWPEAVAVLNADDERVDKFSEVARGKVIRFSAGGGNSAETNANRGAAAEFQAEAPAEFRAEAIDERGIAGSEFDFVWPRGRARLALPLIGRHNVMNAVAALAAASVWGIGAEEARQAFASLKPADKRGEVAHFEDGFSVINDSYNSSPTALAAVIALLGTAPGYERRILAAGEMLELGPSSAELHREAGRTAVADGKIGWIFAVQGQAKELVEGAIGAGFPRERAKWFENSQEAAKHIEAFLKRGDLLLLKGSRGTRMEKILEAIEARHRRTDASGTGVKGPGVNGPSVNRAGKAAEAVEVEPKGHN
jgi:UDP-N-acetylmuramoyl-tripeptide--D-alanyl-D-alanine ligase